MQVSYCRTAPAFLYQTFVCLKHLKYICNITYSHFSQGMAQFDTLQSKCILTLWSLICAVDYWVLLDAVLFLYGATPWGI